MGKDVPGPGSYAAADTPATRRGGGGGQAPALKGRVDVFIKPAHTVGPGSYFESLQQDRLLSLRPSTRKIDFGAGSPRGSEPAGLAASAGRGPGMYPEGAGSQRGDTWPGSGRTWQRWLVHTGDVARDVDTGRTLMSPCRC